MLWVPRFEATLQARLRPFDGCGILYEGNFAQSFGVYCACVAMKKNVAEFLWYYLHFASSKAGNTVPCVHGEVLRVLGVGEVLYFDPGRECRDGCVWCGRKWFWSSAYSGGGLKSILVTCTGSVMFGRGCRANNLEVV